MTASADSRYLFSVVREAMRAHDGPLLDFAFGGERIELPDGIERLATADPRAALRRCSVEETDAMTAAAREWLQRSFGVRVEASGILPVPGGRAAMGALVSTLIRPGDRVLVTEPGYPAFRRVAQQAHAAVFTVAQDPRHGFEPATATLEGGPYRLIALNSPNNPTGSIADRPTLEALARFSDQRTVWFNDATYAALTFAEPGYSLLAASATLKAPTTIELHALGKLLPLGPMSAAFLAGDPAVIGRILELSEFLWSPLSSLQVRLATACLTQDDHLRAIRDRILARVDRLAQTLRGIGFEVFRSGGGLYLLTRSPATIDGRAVAGARQAARLLLERHGLAVVPFEQPPDHYLRFSVLYRSEDLDRLEGIDLSVQP